MISKKSGLSQTDGPLTAKAAPLDERIAENDYLTAVPVFKVPTAPV